MSSHSNIKDKTFDSKDQNDSSLMQENGLPSERRKSETVAEVDIREMLAPEVNEDPDESQEQPLITPKDLKKTERKIEHLDHEIDNVNHQTPQSISEGDFPKLPSIKSLEQSNSAQNAGESEISKKIQDIESEEEAKDSLLNDDLLEASPDMTEIQTEHDLIASPNMMSGETIHKRKHIFED